MEGQNVKAIAVMAMFVTILLGQATARFDKCYAECYMDCIIDMRKTIPYVPKKFLPCAWKCVKRCIFHPASTGVYYCNIGCILDSCADFCDDATKMESCAGNCSKNFCNVNQS